LGEVQTVLMDMDCAIKGNVSCNIDGSYTVFINSRYNFEQQKEIFIHELLHVINDDFGDLDVDIIEEIVRKYEF